MSLNCVITDDDPIAQEILQDYILTVPGLTFAGKCKNAMETLAIMRQKKVDVLFMDIQMPGLNGIEYLRSIKTHPAVILTTAFSEYAVQGFDLNVVDYLLKPIAFERFLKAVDKIFSREISNQNPAQNEGDIEPSGSFFFIKSTQDLIKVIYGNILYIEGLENYVRIVCEEKTITALVTMKYMENILPHHNFIRIHRSFIVNINKVDTIQNYSFQIGAKELNTGRVFRKDVMNFLKKHIK
jgi:DNA-binding LytR/AlgR family response regulator